MTSPRPWRPLADRFGVELKREREDPQEEERRKRRERLLALLERTTGFYATLLWDAPEAGRARDYLAGARAGGGGAARVPRRLRAQGVGPGADRRPAGRLHSEAELLAAGLASRGRDGGLSTASASGSCSRWPTPAAGCSASARARCATSRARSTSTPPENELYHKGRQLFGIDRARTAIAKSGRAVVVEGYTDVLALHQAGVEEAVAIMGTAAHPGPARRAGPGASGAEGTRVRWRSTPTAPGQDAMLRAARMAAERERGAAGGPAARGHATPPSSWCRTGAEAVADRLTQSLSVLEFEVGRVLADADLEQPRRAQTARWSQTRELIAAAPERSARPRPASCAWSPIGSTCRSTT